MAVNFKASVAKIRPFNTQARAQNEIPDLPTVLVVDDENGPRQALRMLLKEDFEVIIATNVAEALGILAEQPVQLIITDIRMPKQSGVDLLRQAKAEYPHIEVIIMTGYGQLDTAMEAVKHGAFAYLEKPFDNDAMLEIVHAAHRRYTEERERRALEQMALEASRFETLGRLVSGMMHDIGSPLTVLSSQIELLMINSQRDDLPERLQTMKAQVEHCSDMARSTMNYLRYDQQDGLPWRMNIVVTSCLEIASSLLRDQRVELQQDLSQALPMVGGDIVLVRQAILNLLINACQAMEANERSKKILIKTWTEDGHACLSVTDSGPGIPEHHRHKIFNTFYSTKGNEGTGLGLSVVQNVMRKCGGTVELGSATEEGASFILRFPSAE